MAGACAWSGGCQEPLRRVVLAYIIDVPHLNIARVGCAQIKR